jgi:HTH-type transcriptional regulator/antitoxin HigA
MTNIIIKNEDQYKKYLKEAEDLIDKDPAIDTLAGQRLSLLTSAIEEYENNLFSFRVPSPIEAIRFRMEEQGLKQNDLISYIGSRSKVSEVLSGKKALTLPMIRAINRYMDIPLEILIQESKKEPQVVNLDNIDCSRFPFNEMIKRGWINSTLAQARSNPKKVISEFCKPIGGFLPQEIMWKRTFHYRIEDKTDTYNLLIWATRVMLLAEQEKVEEYNKNLITVEYLKELAKLSQFSQGPLLAREMLAKYGIILIFQTQLPKTKIDGGCFLDSKGHPVIGMSLRHDRIDNFWHTLLHEMAHVYKHLDNKNFFIDDLERESLGNFQENQADKIARDSFIPRAVWKRSDAYMLRTREAILELGRKLSISPAIIAGRIRFETNDYTKFADLIGQGKVKKLLREYINE